MEKLLWTIFSIAFGFMVWTFISGDGSLSTKTYLVQSGSMEPTIKVGDVIVVQPQDQYFVNDVVTFTDNEGRRVTHRIMDIDEMGEEVEFTTKGDANRDEDRETVEMSQVTGRVTTVVPKLGFVVNFAKTTPGFLLLVIFPAAWILVGEFSYLTRSASGY